MSANPPKAPAAQAAQPRVGDVRTQKVVDPETGEIREIQVRYTHIRKPKK